MPRDTDLDAKRKEAVAAGMAASTDPLPRGPAVTEPMGKWAPGGPETEGWKLGEQLRQSPPRVPSKVPPRPLSPTEPVGLEAPGGIEAPGWAAGEKVVGRVPWAPTAEEVAAGVRSVAPELGSAVLEPALGAAVVGLVGKEFYDVIKRTNDPVEKFKLLHKALGRKGPLDAEDLDKDAFMWMKSHPDAAKRLQDEGVWDPGRQEAR